MITNEERLNLEARIAELIAERDALIRAVADHVTVRCKQRQQIVALAMQNQQMREALLRLATLGNGSQYGNSIGNCIAQEVLSLPDLSTEIIKRHDADKKDAARYRHLSVDIRWVVRPRSEDHEYSDEFLDAAIDAELEKS